MALVNYPNVVTGYVYRLRTNKPVCANFVKKNNCRYPELGFNVINSTTSGVGTSCDYLGFLNRQDAEDFANKYVRGARIHVTMYNNETYYRIDNDKSIPCYALWRGALSKAASSIQNSMKKAGKTTPDAIEAGYETYWWNYINDKPVQNPFQSIDQGLIDQVNKTNKKLATDKKILQAWSSAINLPYEMWIDIPHIGKKHYATIEIDNGKIDVHSHFYNGIVYGYLEGAVGEELAEYGNSRDLVIDELEDRYFARVNYNGDGIRYKINTKLPRTSPADTKEKVLAKLKACQEYNEQLAQDFGKLIDALLPKRRRIGLDIFDEN